MCRLAKFVLFTGHYYWIRNSCFVGGFLAILTCDIVVEYRKHGISCSCRLKRGNHRVWDLNVICCCCCVVVAIYSKKKLYLWCRHNLRNFHRLILLLRYLITNGKFQSFLKENLWNYLGCFKFRRENRSMKPYIRCRDAASLTSSSVFTI